MLLELHSLLIINMVLFFVCEKLVIKYGFWQLQGPKLFLTMNIQDFDNLFSGDQYKGGS